MKKLLLLLTVVMLTFSLSACKEEEPRYDIPEEETILKTSLPYYDFMRLNNPIVTIHVEDMGEIVLELFPDEAPNTVANFIAYIEREDYKGNTFHRVIEDFMIQGGKLESPSCTIIGEMNNNSDFSGTNDLSHYRGVISMARVGGNYNSGSSQFFINHVDYPYLDDEYAPFGGMISGFNILDFIATRDTDNGDAPIESIVIENITVDYNGYTKVNPVCE